MLDKTGELELYPMGAEVRQFGLDWSYDHRSTHPPTCFLFVLPFALLDHQSALVLWAACMFACIVLTARVLGLKWWQSAAFGVLSLVWPPTIWSLYQVTPIWMLGLALAYRFRHHPPVSGAFIGVASLPKFLAAPALLYYLRRRRWLAIVGFCALWASALALLSILRPDAIAVYLTTGSSVALDQTLRQDNGALVVVAWRMGGWVGLVVVAAFVLWAFWSGLRREDPVGWACLVWLGIALLPIAWVYSVLPLLPWLVKVFKVAKLRTRVLIGLAFLAPYAAAVPGQRSWSVTLAIVLSGLALLTTPRLDSEWDACSV
ncbi:MAG: DUF2029 domain-containing protein [Anaerolineae bacterium]|nr:DUF2029 domain-containing protein [Anaerolineae bacterium]